MAGRVEGKTALVSGGGAGIGRGIALRLAAEGATVVVANRTGTTGGETVRLIAAAGGRAAFCQTDVCEETSCAAAVEFTLKQFGGLDVLVNCAGISPRGTLTGTSRELWDRVMATNVRGAFFLCKHAVPVMETAGGGSVINIGSGHGYQGSPNLVAYAASKGALLNLTKTLAKAYARRHIRFNLVMPGWVLTDNERQLLAAEGLTEGELPEAARRTPMGRFQTPDDAAFAVVYLASDESQNVTGTVINANGGWMIVG